MATTTYESSFGKRLFNGLMKAAIRLGIGPKDTWVLSVPGRKTGKVHSTPVTLVEEGGKR